MDSLLTSLAAWAFEHPVWLLVGSAAPGLLALVVSELAGWGRASGTPAPVVDPAPLQAPPPALRPEPVAEPERVVPEPELVAEPGRVVPEPELVAEPGRVVPEPEPVVTPERVAEPEPVVTPEPEPVRLRDRLRRTHDALVGRLSLVLGGRSVDAELLEDLEGVLFGADLGVRTAEDLLERVRRAAGSDGGAVRDMLREAILEKLLRVQPAAETELTAKLHVILVLGVNGSGKTTTIGKLAALHAGRGREVVLGAGDTFRAAATEQLQAWGSRVGCDVIAGQPGGDPSAVAFDTVKAAIARGADVAIIDTAGRLQTKKPLMEELGKMNRVIGRDLEGAPHETLLILDANTGQNAISQARLFTEVANVTGLVLTKLDGTAKGGVIVGLADEFDIPVKYVGVGESLQDLREFSAEEFVDALFAD